MTQDQPKSKQNPSRVRLLEEFKNVELETDQTPTLAQLEERGAYTADEFRAVFGSHATLVEAAQRHKNQILVAVRKEQSKYDHTPRSSEIQESECEVVSDWSLYFDSWQETLEAAEVLPTADEIIEAIQQAEADVGRIPSTNDFLSWTKYRRVDYLHNFESWEDALSAAGFGVDEDELYSEIRRVTDGLVRTPTLAEFEEAAPSAYESYNRSDQSWMETLDDAGVLPSEGDIIREINRVASEMNHHPSAGDFVKRTDIRSVVYQHYFGNWISALIGAGVLPTKHELVDRIRTLGDELGSIPDRSDFLEKPEYSESTYEYHFDSWEEALEVAGVLPSRADFLSLVRSEATGSDWIEQNVIYQKDGLPSRYHEQFFDSWMDVMEISGVAPTKEEFRSMVQTAKADRNCVDKEQVYGDTELPTDYHTRFFDSWEDTLDSADVFLEKQQFLSVLQDTAQDEGWINQREFYSKTDLHSGYHDRFFDSWVEALDAAGVLPSTEKLLQHLGELETESNHLPSRSEAMADVKYPETVYRHQMGSWKETLNAAGLLPTREELLDEVRDLKDDVGGIPSKADASESGVHELDIYRFRFGSWEGVLEAAGLLSRHQLTTEVERLAAKTGPVVTPDDVYDASGLPKGYHERFFDSWKAVLESTGTLDGTLHPSAEERLLDVATEWGRPPSEEYARRNLGISTRATPSDGTRITLDWGTVLRTAGLEQDHIDADADFIKEIEQLAEALGHRPNRTELTEYLVEKSKYVTDNIDIESVIEQAAVPPERELTPTRSLTRQCYERHSSDIPSHTDLLAELNIIRSRTESDKSAVESAFENRGVIDERHYIIQFGSVAAAVDELFAIDTRRFRAPIERNFSLTPGLLRDSVGELRDILERPPLLEEVISLGEASFVDFAETFDSWERVTDTGSTMLGWSNEELLNDVEEVGRNLGKPPTHEEMLEFGTVPVQCLLRRFGTWPRVLWLVGVDIDTIPQDYPGYDFTSELWSTTDYLVREGFGHDHALLDELHRLSFEFDRVPSEELVQQYSPYTLETFTDAFESIPAASERGGMTNSNAGRSPTPNPEELLRDLQAVSESATTWVLPQDISLHTDYSVGTYIGKFQSLESALQQANMPTDHLVGPTKTYRDAWHAEHQMKAGVLRAIADLSSRGEDMVTMARLQSIAGISQNVVYRFFDDWDEALEAAHVRESLETIEIDPNEVDNPNFVDDLLSEMDEMMEEH